jgi:hypothetical protein
MFTSLPRGSRGTASGRRLAGYEIFTVKSCIAPKMRRFGRATMRVIQAEVPGL